MSSDPRAEQTLTMLQDSNNNLKLDLAQLQSAYAALRELKETLASHLQMRVDADIALENKWRRILARAAGWRKE